MPKCAIVSAFYYIENSGFTYSDIPIFVDKINSTDDNINFCSTDMLTKPLDEINTRLIDRQSLSLEAALKIAEDGGFFDNLNKSELSIIAGSYSSSVYPSAAFNLSIQEKGANFVNATEFTNTVGNAAVSRACIWNQFRGEAHAISEGVNSGLDAVIDAYNDIKYGNTNDILACTSEEIGSAAVLIQNGNLKNLKNKPIAYIKNCDSTYFKDYAELLDYFNSIEDRFNINFSNTCIYLSGDFDKITELSKTKNLEFKKIINKNLWSLAPLINIGRCLYDYKSGTENKNSLIFSVDEKGFASSALITKGGD